MPVGEIGLDQAKEFRNTYCKLPRNRTSTERKNMSIAELIALDDPVKVSATTVNQRVQTISSMFHWLNVHDPQIRNVFKDLFTVKSTEGETRTGNRMKKRLPFTRDELSKLFSSDTWSKHDCHYIWEFWLPLVLLYTGMRVTEFCQLVKSDFKEVHGIWVMSINDLPTKDEPEQFWEKSLKTDNSLREIPIHDHLIELGFRDFVESSPKGRLFPDILPIGGKLAKTPCRRFNEFILPEAGIKSKMTKTLYSLRHTALNALKQKDISSEQRAQLAGHAPDLNNMSESTYGDEYEVQFMHRLVHQLDFRDVMKYVNPGPFTKRELAVLEKRAMRREKQMRSRQRNKAVQEC